MRIENLTISSALEILNQYDKNKIVELGWGEDSGHSNRGYYSDLGLEPQYNVTIGEMIDELKNCVGRTFTGWKGGEFEMDMNTDIHLSNEGSCGTNISNIFLELLIENRICPSLLEM